MSQYPAIDSFSVLVTLNIPALPSAFKPSPWFCALVKDEVFCFLLLKGFKSPIVRYMLPSGPTRTLPPLCAGPGVAGRSNNNLGFTNLF